MSMRHPTLRQVLSDASRVIATNRRHFAALSLLFLLPNTIASIIYTFLSGPTSLTHSYTSAYQRSLSEKPQVLLPILYLLSVFLFSLCASSSITFTAFHGLHAHPVTFISSLKSIATSLFPLIATAFATQIIVWLIIFAFLIFLLVVYNALALFGFEMDYDSSYFLVFVISMFVLLVGFLIYLRIQWCFSTPVVVLESKWGFAPLKRSSHLLKGMRRVVFHVILIFAIPVVLLSVWYYGLMKNVVSGGLRGWGVVQMVVYACLTTLLSLYGLAANTVLFVYAKALHGETAAFWTDEEMGREYVPLPVDEGVAPYVYTVVKS